MPKLEIEVAVAQLRATFRSHRTRPYEWRIAQLSKLKELVLEKEDAIFAALNVDLGRSNFESFLTETSGNITEIDHALANLRDWMKPRTISTPLPNQPGHSEIVHEPLGVVLPCVGLLTCGSPFFSG